MQVFCLTANCVVVISAVALFDYGMLCLLCLCVVIVLFGLFVGFLFCL